MIDTQPGAFLASARSSSAPMCEFECPNRVLGGRNSTLPGAIRSTHLAKVRDGNVCCQERSGPRSSTGKLRFVANRGHRPNLCQARYGPRLPPVLMPISGVDAGGLRRHAAGERQQQHPERIGLA
jgi:hypothetical protein